MPTIMSIIRAIFQRKAILTEDDRDIVQRMVEQCEETSLNIKKGNDDE